MTNFDFLTLDPQFNTFSSVAVSAEKIMHIDPAAGVINCRQAMEFAVKWISNIQRVSSGSSLQNTLQRIPASAAASTTALSK